MSRAHTKAVDSLDVIDHANVLIDLLLIAQSACAAQAEELLQCGAISGARVMLERASQAYDLRLRLEVCLTVTSQSERT